MPLTQDIWGTYEGRNMYRFTLVNANTKVVVSNFGCTIIEISSANNGHNLLLSYPDFESYLSDTFYLNCIVGRVANRVGDGQLIIGDKQYQLTINEHERNNHIHGGFQGFNRRIFEVANVTSTSENAAVTLRTISDHLDEGYPGRVFVEVTFSVDRTGHFTIKYDAESDQDTHLNLTHHPYFKRRTSSVYSADDRLFIASDYMLENNERFLPTGRMVPVEGTNNDFRNSRSLYIHEAPIEKPVYNNYYFFRKAQSSNTFPIEVWFSNGTSMKISTSYPGVILYSGDYLGSPFRPMDAFCLECQFPPDASKHANLPTTLLKAGSRYNHFITHQFSWHD